MESILGTCETSLDDETQSKYDVPLLRKSNKGEIEINSTLHFCIKGKIIIFFKKTFFDKSNSIQRHYFRILSYFYKIL